MATYVNDLRLKEIGTGESSGTWGTETNVNLELIGEALGFGTEAITTNADTHTTTVADGSTDPGRAMYLKYTGTLDSACTITIAPNTISRMQFIENGTSGSQNIIISQGTGANVTIPAGDTKAVYLDGAGSGAAVVDAFASLSTVDLKVQDDLTVTDDVAIGGLATVGGTLGVTGIATFTDDIIIGDGKTIGSASDVDAMTIASNGQITLTQTLIGTALDISGDIDVDGTTNLDVVDIDGALTQDGGAVFNEASADVDFRVESNGDANMFIVDGGNDRVGIGTGTPGFTFDLQKSLSESYSASGRPTALARVMNTNTADNNHATIEFGTEPSSGNGGVGFIGSTVTASNLADLFFGTRTGASSFATHMTIKSGGDTRIGTSTNPYTFAQKLIVGDGNDNDGITIQSGSTHQGNLAFNKGDGTTAFGRISYQQDSNFMAFLVNNSEKLRITSAGVLSIGDTTPESGDASAPTSLFLQGGEANMIIKNTDASSSSQRQGIAFLNSSGTRVGTITITSSATGYATSSDYRLKENVKTLPNGLDRLNSLKPVQFDWKTDGVTSEGFLAHEVKAVFPYAVKGEKDAEEMQSMDYGRITPLLVKAIQEQQEQIEQLKTEISKLH